MRLLEKHIIPLFKTIYKKTDLSVEEKILKSSIPMSSLMLIQMKQRFFYEVYKKYFKEDIGDIIVKKSKL